MTNERVWLITGATSGFGRAIVEAALAAGDRVVAAARRKEALDDLVERYPGRVHAVVLDVTEQKQIADAVAEAVLWQGRVDVLVNNAGRGLVGAVEETTDRELRDLMDVHFFGPAALTRRCCRTCAKRGVAIVQMSSMGGRFSFPGVGAYGDQVRPGGLSEALAQEVAPFGIKVLVVEPGAFRTSFAGGGLYQTSAMPEYAESVGPVRTNLPDSDGRQPGDPAKAAAAIVAALDADETPLRLPLGNDAADAVAASLEERSRSSRAGNRFPGD